MKKSFWIPFICMLWITLILSLYTTLLIGLMVLLPTCFLLACTELYLEGVFDED